MTYELAKELKEAGFPDIHFHCVKKDHECRANKPDCEMRVLSAPTLSELIEACGDGFSSLIRSPATEFKNNKEVWMTYGNGKAPCFGDTPDIAVARLWLALNPPKEI